MLNYKTKWSQQKRAFIFSRDIFSCCMCGFEITEKPANYTGDRTLMETGKWLEIDHITPISKGGDDGLGNLQTLCNVCNCKKGVRV